MNTKTDLAAQTAHFRATARDFTPLCKTRYAKLLPFREGIAELRKKGASYDLIRELLVQAGLTVAVDTVGNFVREVIEQRSRPQRKPHRAHTAPTMGSQRLPFTVAPAASKTSGEATAKQNAK